VAARSEGGGVEVDDDGVIVLGLEEEDNSCTLRGWGRGGGMLRGRIRGSGVLWDRDRGQNTAVASTIGSGGGMVSRVRALCGNEKLLSLARESMGLKF
jgi:hypothetical protein